MASVLQVICCCGLELAGLAAIQAQDEPGGAGASAPRPASSASISISPPVIMVRGEPGHGTTHTLTIVNSMPNEMRFVLEAQDVAIRDGKRVYVPAGQIPSGIASGTVITPATIVVPPGRSAAVSVTLTMPPATEQRAVVVYFKGRPSNVDTSKVAFGVALGALITFHLPGDAKVVAGAITASAQNASANVSLAQELENTGTEPAVATGALVILNEKGKRIAKVSIEPHRLLPGERTVLPVMVPTALSAGRYRVLASFEYDEKVLTNVGEFTIPE
jgi:hypothetical protein